MSKASSSIKVFGRANRPTSAIATKRTSRPFPSRLISVQQFCDAYSLGKTRAYELLNAGEIEAIKSGHRTLILLESVEAWVERLQPFGAGK